MKYIRQLYDWVLGWAHSPFGAIALFLLSFSESVFFPVPPDILLIAMVLSKPAGAFRLALICTLGSIMGALAGYGIGHFIWLTPEGEFTAFAGFFFNHIPGFTHELYLHIKSLFDEWSFWVVFTAGFTPIPYKVFTITSGVFDLNLIPFLVASIISRGARFFMVAGLIWKFGPPIQKFIDKYFNLLAIAFTILLVGGFVLIKYVM